MTQIEARPRRVASRHQGFKRQLASFSNKLAKLIDELQEAEQDADAPNDHVLVGFIDSLTQVHDQMLRILDR